MEHKQYCFHVFTFTTQSYGNKYISMIFFYKKLYTCFVPNVCRDRLIILDSVGQRKDISGKREIPTELLIPMTEFFFVKEYRRFLFTTKQTTLMSNHLDEPGYRLSALVTFSFTNLNRQFHLFKYFNFIYYHFSYILSSTILPEYFVF